MNLVIFIIFIVMHKEKISNRSVILKMIYIDFHNKDKTYYSPTIFLLLPLFFETYSYTFLHFVHPETKSQGLFHQIHKEVTFCGLLHGADA